MSQKDRRKITHQLYTDFRFILIQIFAIESADEEEYMKLCIDDFVKINKTRIDSVNPFFFILWRIRTIDELKDYKSSLKWHLKNKLYEINIK